MRISDWSSDVCSSDLVQVGGREHAQHAWRGAGLGEVDAGDLGVGDRGPHVGDVGRAVELRGEQVCDVGATHREQRRVLDPHDAVAEDAQVVPSSASMAASVTPEGATRAYGRAESWERV